MYYVMSDICMRIRESPRSSGIYVYDESYGDVDDGGCGYWLDGRFSPVRYEATDYHPQTLYFVNQTMRAVSIRLGSDTWAYASYITGGTLNFGSTVPTYAYGLGVTGIVLALLPIFFIVCLYVAAQLDVPCATRTAYVLGFGFGSDAITNTMHGMHHHSEHHATAELTNRTHDETVTATTTAALPSAAADESTLHSDAATTTTTAAHDSETA
jgi:hypothetical protein